MDWSTFVIPLFGGPTTLAGFWAAAGLYAVLILLIWAGFWSLFSGSALLKQMGGHDVPPARTWALKCAMVVHHAIVGPLSLVASLQDPALVGVYACMGCATEAWNLISTPGSTAAPASIQALMPVTMGYMIADLILLPSWSLTAASATETALTVMHHVMSLLVWPFTLYNNYCARYVLILLNYEITSIFLTINWILSNLGLKKNLIYKVNGTIFTVLFIILRMIGAVPQLRAMWEVPPWSDHAIQQRYGGPAAPHQVLALYTMVVPHVLNLFWGVKVVKGYAAVMRKAFKKD